MVSRKGKRNVKKWNIRETDGLTYTLRRETATFVPVAIIIFSWYLGLLNFIVYWSYQTIATSYPPHPERIPKNKSFLTNISHS